jgi:Uma2 family endonuclease
MLAPDLIGDIADTLGREAAGGRRIYSREEFRHWYERQVSGRYERIDGRIVAMAPERGAHLRVKAAVWLALRNAIKAAGVACQALPGRRGG